MYPKTGSFYRIRKAPNSSGGELARVENASSQIRSFLPKKCSDGFQWALVKYGSLYGYAQVDLFNFNKITSSSLGDLRVHTVNSAMNVRQTLTFNASNKPNGTILTTVPKNGDATIINFEERQKDNYQWARASYKGHTGYVQLDTLNCYIIDGALRIENL